MRALIKIIAAVFLTAALLGPVTTPAQAMPAPNKGPIGWDLYRRLDRAAELRTGVQTRQFSSFDRTGANDDGFVGTHSCLRTTTAGCVIAEHTGPGEIASIWFTRNYGFVGLTGTIHIELDGQTVLNAPLQDLVSSRVGAPWVWPLVGNGDDTSGGAVIKVPMPYQRSMRITVQNNPLFYHVTYRVFADAVGVPTFDPSDPANDVIAMLRSFGAADPKPMLPASHTQESTVDIQPAGQAELARVHGPGWITQLRLRLPQVKRAPRVADDGRAYTGGSSFTMAIDPGNNGVRITRRYDPRTGNQRARFLVDGQPVGEWTSGAPTGAGAWDDQTIDIPTALTAGKSRISITNEFVSSDVDVNEFRYDAASNVNGRWTRTDTLDVGPGHPNEERAHGYTIRGETWKGVRTIGRYPISAADILSSDAILADTRLRITFDGRTTVDSPLGEFFGSGLGEFDTRSLFFSLDAGPDGWYTAWWPMPFAYDAVIELVNGSGETISGGEFEIQTSRDAAVAARLRGTGDLGYFHATSVSGPTVSGQDWVFLDTTGSGVFYGVTQTMRGRNATGNRRIYLEGDERVYVDGSASPAWHGTGTEDFYESGWYFRDGTTFSLPQTGNPAHEVDGDGCTNDCRGAYRLMVADAVPFESSLRFSIEHGSNNTIPADYSSTAYWYGQEEQTLSRTDSLDVGDTASRADHGYSATGESSTTLVSTFEGDNDSVSVTDDVSAASGPIEFELAVVAQNRGVRLDRVSDQATSSQAADVYVDGVLIGRWAQPLGNATSRWIQDNFEIPAGFTAGKARLSVRLAPVDGAPLWTASRYAALSRLTVP